ncbi:unnamed protein product, partial [Ectocarpus sp. 12 AP-2014]
RCHTSHPRFAWKVYTHNTCMALLCPAYAKVPSGDPISVEWLNSILPQQQQQQQQQPRPTQATITRFKVDEASTIEGRHSVTFRLLLDWSSSREEAAEDGNATGPTRVCSGPLASVFVKRMTCRELPARSLTKWRTSIASYRAEATFFKTVAGSAALDAIVPHAFWVHVDERLGGEEETGTAAAVGTGGTEADATIVEALRESCFMMITEDLGTVSHAGCGENDGEADAENRGPKKADWEQVGSLDLGRAKAVLSAAAHLHASFWPEPPPGAAGWEPRRHCQPQSPQRQEDHGREQQRHPDLGSGHHRCDGEGRYARGLHKQGTFWSLEKRDAGDLAGLEEEYKKLLGNFRPLLPAPWFEAPHHGGDAVEDAAGRPGGCAKGDERHLGRRLAARALSLDAAVHANGDGVLSSSGGGKRGRSLVHGDLKTWNVFFKTAGWAEAGEQGEGAAARDCGGGDASGPAPAAGGKVKIIDWQWCGEGLAAADAAYVICTSLEPSLLSRERELLDHYHAELSRGLEARFGKPPAPEGGGGSDGVW